MHHCSILAAPQHHLGNLQSSDARVPARTTVEHSGVGPGHRALARAPKRSWCTARVGITVWGRYSAGLKTFTWEQLREAGRQLLWPTWCRVTPGQRWNQNRIYWSKFKALWLSHFCRYLHFQRAGRPEVFLKHLTWKTWPTFL